MAKPKAKTAPKKKTTKTPKSQNGKAGIRIRMYRVGFGDFFLVSFDDQHVVIDCGVFKGTHGTGDIGSIEAAIANMKQETGGKLALVIMTHRHADHIAGFGRFVDVFRTFDVAAVWMPAWENEYDSTAKKFQAELTSLALDLQQHLDFQIAAGSAVSGELYYSIGNATGNELGATAKGKGGGGKNAVALDLLKHGWKAKPQYLKAGDRPTLPQALADLGLIANVLGPPPVDDIELMKLMDLKKGVGEYLAMSDEAAGDTTAWQPFSAPWFATGEAYPPVAFAEWKSRGDLEQALQSATPTALAAAATKLDSFLNNQSLVVLFTFRGKNLLFVGDAQGGNWEHWLYDTDEADKAPTGPLSRRAKEILDGVDVYKVGHHGSTNATPIVVSKEIRQGAVALCSTQKGVYGESVATAVPLQKLMDALDERVGLVRSDQLDVEVDGKTIKAAVQRALPKQTDGALEQGELWIDYVL